MNVSLYLPCNLRPSSGPAPVADAGDTARPSLLRLSALVLIAGAPAILGAWLGGFLAGVAVMYVTGALAG